MDEMKIKNKCFPNRQSIDQEMLDRSLEYAKTHLPNWRHAERGRVLRLRRVDGAEAPLELTYTLGEAREELVERFDTCVLCAGRHCHADSALGADSLGVRLVDPASIR